MTASVTALIGVISIAALAWMLYQLARKPGDSRLRAITSLIASWAIAFPFGFVASEGHGFLGLDALACRLIQHSLLLIGAYALMCFYLFSALEGRAAAMRASWLAAPVAIAIAVLVLATVLMPGHLRDAAAMVPAKTGEGPFGVPEIGVFYLTANGGMLYAFAAAVVWMWRYARDAQERLRRGLRVAAIGMTVIVVADSTFIAANIFRWAGSLTPQWIVTIGVMLLPIGILLFLAGISYPAVLMRLAALRVWRRHRRAYRQLGPLWTVLHQEFPEDALNRVPDKPGVFDLRGVHRRYYRRVVECRDGLVRISPYLANEHGEGGKVADDDLAARLKRALRAHSAGERVPTQAIAVAVPESEDLDADVERLIALSQALQRT